jgi:hypothetical protein
VRILALLDQLVDDADDGRIVELDALRRFPSAFIAASSMRIAPRRSLSLARIAPFMSSVIWSFEAHGSNRDEFAVDGSSAPIGR